MKRDGGGQSVQRSKHLCVANLSPRATAAHATTRENCSQVEDKTSSHNEIDRIGTDSDRTSIFPGPISVSRRRELTS